MFASFRRHKWLWVVIFTLTILSFVAFFSPKNMYGYGDASGSGKDTIGSIYGKPITRDEYSDAYREAALRYFFTYNQWPQNNRMAQQLGLMESETRNRLLLIHKINELGIKVSDDATVQWIKEMFRDPETQVFRKDAYEQFVKQRIAQVGLRQADFERFARHEVGIQHLVNVAGLAGKLVTPQEAEAAYRLQNEEVDTQAIFITSSNYLGQVQVDPASLNTYFTNHLAEYRIPEKVQVSYVKFSSTNYLAEADNQLNQNTNLNQILEMTYQQRGTNSFVDADNKPLPPDAAKQKLRGEIRQQAALIEARRRATEFANKLLELPAGTNNLAKVASSEGIPVQVTPPFTQGGRPPGLNVPETFARAAFRLTPEQPIHEEPIVGEDGVYLIAFNQRIPSEIPSLDSVRDRVTEDFKRSRAAELARAAGEELQKSVASGLTGGKTLQAIAAEKNVRVVDLPPFSENTPAVPDVRASDLPVVKNTAFALAPGNVSDYKETRNGGVIVYLQNRVPVGADKVKAELPNFLTEMQRTRLFEAFSDWLRKESEAARINLPGDQPQTAQK